MNIVDDLMVLGEKIVFLMRDTWIREFMLLIIVIIVMREFILLITVNRIDADKI